MPAEDDWMKVPLIRLNSAFHCIILPEHTKDPNNLGRKISVRNEAYPLSRFP